MNEGIIFKDGARAGSLTRKLNIQLLEINGFTKGGVPCRSGEMYIVNLKDGRVRISFGIKANVYGRGGSVKYFSLDRTFKNKAEAAELLETFYLRHEPPKGSLLNL